MTATAPPTIQPDPGPATACRDRATALGRAQGIVIRPARTPIAVQAPSPRVDHHRRCPALVAGESARGACLCGAGL